MTHFIQWKDPQDVYHYFSTHSDIQSCLMPGDDWYSGVTSIHQVADPKGECHCIPFFLIWVC